MPLSAKNFLIKEILKKYFYQLFYSWSFSIRDVFCSFLLYQIRFSYIEKTIMNLDQINNTSDKQNQGSFIGSTLFNPLDKKEDQVKKKWKNNLKQAEESIKNY